ncbi:MAG TPA: PQQ-binding-like beta-propeller repeat protein [Tepidisphaeraceae bacterium]|nr:PQQ-binding-like beta-propeller repeat protein [Tepidisphaeraceae bacterium]
MNKHLSTVVSGIVLLALGAAGCANRPEPQAAPERPVVPVNPPALIREWRAPLDLGDNRVTQLHLSDDYLFVYTNSNTTYTFDRKSGTRVFVTRLNGRPQHAPVVLTDLIVYPTASTLEVYNRRGRFVRSVALGHTIRTGAVVAANRVVVGVDVNRRGRVLFVDVTQPYPDVTPILTMGGLTAQPATRQGLTFIGSEDGSVYAISPELDGAWALPGGAFETAGSIVGDLAADTGTTGNVYVASTDTKLYALAATSGQLRWQYYAGAALTTGPTVTAEMLYQFVPGTGLVAIDKNNGDAIRAARWAIIDATKLVAEDAQLAYVLGTGNKVYGVDKKTGKVRFVSTRDDLSVFAENTTDGTVYAATPGGEIIAATPVLTQGKMGELVLTPSLDGTVVSRAE